jgi:hypothetical protein
MLLWGWIWPALQGKPMPVALLASQAFRPDGARNTILTTHTLQQGWCEHVLASCGAAASLRRLGATSRPA